MAYTALQLPCPSDMNPEAGQPYRLHLLQALANSWGGPAAVPATGYQQVLSQPCHPARHGRATRSRHLPRSETVQSLLRNEIANNWIVETGLSLAEARKKLPLGIAVGKLNVVFAEGKEPRLVLDSTVCHVNTRCHLPERLSLPMASDLALSTQPGASVDFKAAHKQAQVRPEEHGLLLFAFQENSTVIEYAISISPDNR